MDGASIYRRIARYVDAAGELTNPIPDAPIWQERQFNGDFHNIVGPDAKVLEKRFIDALIAANGLDKR
jgi:hypothetical protein